MAALLVGVFVAITAACQDSDVVLEGVGEEVDLEHDEDFVVLDSVAVANVGLEIVEVGSAPENTLEATGSIGYDQNRVARVGPRAQGRVVRIEADLGDRVQRGSTLAVLESPELGEAEAEHERARAELQLATENFERERSLYEKGISSRKEMLEAQTEFESRTAALRAAEARHRTLGARDHTNGSTENGGHFMVSSSMSGTVVERDLVLGQIAGPEDQLFTVADLSRLWLTLDVYDRDLGRVREGAEVEVLTGAFPNERFAGRLTYLGQVVDTLSRTVKARVEVENPDELLRPGMFAQAVVHGLDAGGMVAVPEAALHEIEGRTVVFVADLGSGSNRFEIREVILGSRVGGRYVIILDGLSPGENVVGEGSFYLKSERLKESFGGHQH